MTFRQTGGRARGRAGQRDGEPAEQAQHRDDLEHRGDAEDARDRAAKGWPNDGADVEAGVVHAGRETDVTPRKAVIVSTMAVSAARV